MSRHFFVLMGALLAAFSWPLSAERGALPKSDVIHREYNVLAARDGILVQEVGDDVFKAYPALTRGANDLFFADLPDLLSESASLTFNVFAPTADEPLFEVSSTGSLVLKESAALIQFREGTRESDPTTLAAATLQGLQTRSVGTGKEWNFLNLFRFQIWGPTSPQEAAGPYGVDLSPTCVTPGSVSGWWLKAEVWNPLVLNLKSLQLIGEGTMGRLVNQAGHMQFFWTPRICELSPISRDAVFGDLVKAVDELISDHAGQIGPLIRLTGVDRTIAGFFTDTLYGWLATAGGDFSLTVSPHSAFVKRGKAVEYQVAVEFKDGLTGPVTLSATGLTQSTVTFSPRVLTRSGKSVMTIQTSASSVPAAHSVRVNARGTGGTAHSVDAILTITY